MYPDWALKVAIRQESVLDAAEVVPAAADELVSFRRVSKSYDGRSLIVDNLDLEIRRGEFLTLLGPSGSGKTTTLTMLAGFESPDAGQIVLRGKKIDGLPPEKRNIGVVFQNYALFPHMTVAENVGFPLRVRKIRKAEADQRIERALEMVRLEKFGHRRPLSLSGGQQQRVALARALVFEPELVLMDEPLGALDKQLREELQLEIKRIQQRLKLTILYVTHDQAEALTMSDRIAVFHKGRIQQLGAPDEIYNHPQTEFVATFIGDNNLLKGRIRTLSGEAATVELENGFGVTCESPTGFKEGTTVFVAVRPERVTVNPESDCENRITGTVREIIYMGDETRICASFAHGKSILVKVPNTARLCPPGVDQEIVLGWNVEDCRIIPAS